jgi:ribonuclease H2 subunit B
LSQLFSQLGGIPEITEDIVVYRLSLQKIVEYLRLKVARLAIPEVLEVSRTLIRGLAKDGLVEDGKESLLQGKSRQC